MSDEDETVPTKARQFINEVSSTPAPMPVTVEYSKDVLKFLSDELDRLHDIVMKDPVNAPEWVVSQIRHISEAIISGSPVHTITPERK